MQLNGFWAYAVVELLIVAVAYILYLHYRMRSLARESSPTGGNAGDESPGIDAYVDQLQEQVLLCDAKLAHLNAAEQPDQRLREIVEARMHFLQSERSAIDSSNADTDRLWNHLSESLGAFLPVEAEPPVPAEADSGQSALVTALQTRIHAYESRIENLEQFKEFFFDLKEKYASMKAIHGQLRTEWENAVPEADQTPEMKAVLDQLQSENERLEEKLHFVEQEFNNIMENFSSADSAGDQGALNVSMENIGDSVKEIKNVIRSQEGQIDELQRVISGLQLELEEKQSLDSVLGKLRDKNEELDSVISVLQEENTFLQEQISALLKQELANQEELEASHRQLNTEMDSQLKAYAELEQKYAAMEQEYLAAYAENQKHRNSGAGS